MGAVRRKAFGGNAFYMKSLRRKAILLIEGIANNFFGRHLGGKYPILRIIHDKLVQALKPKCIEIDGFLIYLDPLDSLRLFRNQRFEVSEQDLIKKEVKEGNFVIDIGAHIGFHTLTLARMVGERGRVFAFEPAPPSFLLLRKNVETNGFGNRVVLSNKAVSDEASKVRLYYSNPGGGPIDSAAYHLRGDGGSFFEVQSISLDELFPDENVRIDFIKMDIEGFEMRGLRGMRKLLTRNRKIGS